MISHSTVVYACLFPRELTRRAVNEPGEKTHLYRGMNRRPQAVVDHSAFSLNPTCLRAGAMLKMIVFVACGQETPDDEGVRNHQGPAESRLQSFLQWFSGC